MSEPTGFQSGITFDAAERALAADTRALVIGPYLVRRSKAADNGRSTAARLDEAMGLAAAIDLTIAQAFIAPLSTLRPATYLGSGKVEEIAALVEAEEAGLVVMDCALSPVQQRNLEKAFGCKVIDRTGLILEIFGRRARTREGTLQVELAHLTYQKSRLVRSWTHLERQRGGFGFLGGPGETQIEADRRVIQERMTKIERDLETVTRTRGLHRKARQRVPYPVVALVGYTNAGKSTLFNRLTSAEVLAQDMLFATLDPTARALKLPHGARIMLSDTVGFISDLPTMLVAAFRATLEDAIEADVILHVRDVAHEDSEAQAQDVTGILKDLGIDPANGQRIIEVWNKLDLLDEEERQKQMALAALKPVATRPVPLSALTGEGVSDLLDGIEARIALSRPVYRLELPPGDGKSLAWLHAESEILERTDADDGTLSLVVRLPPERAGAFLSRFPEAQAGEAPSGK